MAILGFILMAIGGIISLVFGVMLIIQAFKESVLWGLVYLFVPFGALVYVVKFWDQAKGLFLKSLLGLPFYFVGMLMAGTFSQSSSF